MTQTEALDILKMGYNVFLTGQPGSGKTHTLNTYISYLKSHKIEVAVTASTGIAATHIGGTTIHSWSGLGIKTGVSEYQIDDMCQKEYLVKRYEKTEVLIIDEISMMSGVMLDDINRVCQAMKRNEEPFGGLQIVLVGDFFQLPPVSRGGGEPMFAYEANAWKEANLAICYLSEQHRQEDDAFLNILTELRKNDVSQYAYEELLRATSTTFPDDVEPVRLYTHNMNVDQVNEDRLGQLRTDSFTFTMTSKGKSRHVEKMISSCLSPEHLELKIGAIVMCTKNNFELGYVNGTLGKVTDTEKGTGYPIITLANQKKITITPAEWALEDDGRTIASITQIPLRLAWAITVHKSQGMSIDRAEIDLSQTFEYGQGYVALSRVRSLSGLRLLGFNDMALAVNPNVAEKDLRFQKLSDAASDRLKTLTKEEHKKRQEDFIRKCGGVLTPTKHVPEPKTSTYEKTKILVRKKFSLQEIQKERDLSEGTILGHLEKLLDKKELTKKDIAYLKPETNKFAADLKKIKSACKEVDSEKLSPIRKKLDNKFSFEEIRFARLFIS